jgi:ribose 5-phosphate isomerase A
MTVAPSETDAQKRAAAEAAAAEIEAGMLVGLGTGSTAAFLIDALGRRVRAGLELRAVATSRQTAERAAAAGIAIVPLDDLAAIDLAIDGVDEIDPAFRAIKGAGGAMLREKVVAQAARLMIAIADGSKAVARLGGKPVPIETLPLARAFVAARVEALGGCPTLRIGEGGLPWRTEQDNLILDCAFGPRDDWPALAAVIDAIPGALGHGLFMTEIDTLYLGTASGVIRRQRR